MKKNGIERNLVVLLFVLVLVIFSFAERDSRKLDRLYKTAQMMHEKQLAPTAQLPSTNGAPINN